MKRIELVISQSGETTVETKGFAGRDCQAASRFLEAALGKRTSQSLTAEFYKTQQHQSQHSQEET